MPVTAFDGRVIPMAARSVDVVTMFDVLHHADDPPALLAEAARVARTCVVLKDHVGRRLAVARDSARSWTTSATAATASRCRTTI